MENQVDIKSYLDEVKKGNRKLISKEQTSVVQNFQNFFDLREKIIIFFRDYFISISEAKYKTQHGKGLKIITLKQILQRLPIARAVFC